MHRTFALSVHLLLMLATVAPAAGLLLPRSGEAPIRIKSHRVNAVLEDGIARTTVRQTFVNPHGRALEAIYIFPLPAGAALVDVAMEVGGKRLEGLLAERQRARKVYNAIVRSRRDPALVEQIGRAKFRLSVYPVLPDQPTVVEITYIERVPLMRAAYRYVYPLALGGEAAKTEGDLTFNLEVHSSLGLEGVVTTTRGMAVVRRSANAWNASFEKTGAALDQDLVVEAHVAGDRPTLALQTFRGADGDGWFLLLVTPPPAKEGDLVPRDVILVIDTSGSMEGAKILQARASALYLLRNLRPVDRVNVLTFSSSVIPFADGPVAATAENLARLETFVSGIRAEGGTAIADALKAALDVRAVEGRARTVVFLTDGLPTVGETDPAAIVRIARAGRQSGLRVFPFGVGYDVNGGLLSGVAEATRGRAEIFRPGGEIESRLTGFLKRTSAPVLVDLEVTVPSAYDVFPRPLTDVYRGEQLAVVGRYRGGGQGEVALHATAGAKRVELREKFEFRAEPGGARAARDIFARAKLDFLERQRRLRVGLADAAYYAALDRGAYSTADEIVGEIISVSLEHQVQSAYTSFLVLLPEDRHRIDPRDAVALKQALQRVREVRATLRGESKTPPVAKAERKRVEARLDVRTEEELIAEEEEEIEDDVTIGVGGGTLPSVADQPYEGKQSNAAIGLGGGERGAFGSRGGGRRGLRRRYGGSGTAAAADHGLEWLARSQNAAGEGHWPAKQGTVTDSGLALLAFLGAGYTHQAGKYKRHMADALKYLKRTQDASGWFGTPGDRVGHAIATLAMAEAYGMSNSPLLRRPVEKGVHELEAAVRAAVAAETPVEPAATVWTTFALVSARNAGIEVSKQVIGLLRTRVAKVATNDAASPPMARVGPITADARLAAAYVARVFLGEAPSTSASLKGMEGRLLEALARHKAAVGQTDFGFWYFGSLACFQCGGPTWKQFNAEMKRAIVDRQARDLPARGSWDLDGPDAAAHTPVTRTALFGMCLEVYYRYGKVFGTR